VKTLLARQAACRQQIDELEMQWLEAHEALEQLQAELAETP
jgi:ATP-binding cassette subfamily F protein 3